MTAVALVGVPWVMYATLALQLIGDATSAERRFTGSLLQFWRVRVRVRVRAN